MSLYTKYRPKDWDSVLGQDLIVTILRSTLISQTTGHAYIFTGSRGTGKTTSARIFAKAINCENVQNGNPCHQCVNCQSFDNGLHVDIIEIDAASNTSVDDVRDLIDEAKHLPMQWKYKIYIIDEVHMLSGSAFNALLKTLEEPPPHVKFIMATTEINKVPETIRSRAGRFDFQKIHKTQLLERLNFVAQHENIATEDGSLEIIADLAAGGMRDALTLLEQYSFNNSLSKSVLEKSFSLLDTIFLEKLIVAIFEKNFDELTKILEKLKQENISAQKFFDQILFLLRDKMVENMENDDFFRYQEIFLTFREAYSSVFVFLHDWILIETTILSALRGKNSGKILEKIPENSPKNVNENPPKIPEKIQKTPENEAFFAEKIPEKIAEKTENPPKKSSENHNNDAEIGKMIFQQSQEIAKNTENSEQILQKNTTFREFNFRTLLAELPNHNGAAAQSTLKNASFKQKNTHLELFFSSKWFADQANEPKNHNAILATLNHTFGGEWTINAIFKPKSNNTPIDDIF